MKLIKDRRSVVAYDNFNFKDSVRDQVIGSSRSIMRNLTTAILVVNPLLPTDGLFQSSLHPEQPLRVHNVLCSDAGGQCDDDVSRQAARHFVAGVISYLHPFAARRVFGSEAAFSGRFVMPALDVLPAERHQVHLLGTVFENEASIDGTARVHSELFLKQLRLGQQQESVEGDETYLHTAPEFTERLYLAYGDQLTSARIRSVKQEQRNARRAFDRRQWLLGPPAWFHVQQALMILLVKTHWCAPSGVYSRATLVHDVRYLERYNFNKDKP